MVKLVIPFCGTTEFLVQNFDNVEYTVFLKLPNYPLQKDTYNVLKAELKTQFKHLGVSTNICSLFFSGGL